MDNTSEFSELARGLYQDVVKDILVRGLGDLLVHSKANAWVYISQPNLWLNPSSDCTILDEDMPDELRTDWLMYYPRLTA